jgi:hypothetical protein
MGKQPIDDLFARKLREAELSPSPDAFTRLQGRMASTELPITKRRVAVWWYGAAAAGLLLITLFYFRSSSDVNQATLDQVTKQTKVKTSVSLIPKQQLIHLAAKAGEERTHRTVSVSAAQNDPDNRQKKMIATVMNPIQGAEEAKSTATNGKETVQKVVIPSQETTVSNAKKELVAVIINPPVPVQIVQPKPYLICNPADQQRVVVMTITEPVADSPVEALQPTKVESTLQDQPGSLAGLFAKVKQLKNGDLLARTTPAKRPADSRSRLGRVFEGMKESLKNETILE